MIYENSEKRCTASIIKIVNFSINLQAITSKLVHLMEIGNTILLYLISIAYLVSTLSLHWLSIT